MLYSSGTNLSDGVDELHTAPEQQRCVVVERGHVVAVVKHYLAQVLTTHIVGHHGGVDTFHDVIDLLFAK